MEVIFDAWTIDPNGWGRHFAVGLSLYLIARKYNTPFSYIFLFLFAAFLGGAKEYYDATIGYGWFNPANAIPDFLMTILAFALVFIWPKASKTFENAEATLPT